MKRPRARTIGWHVYARGARRLAIFHDDEDRAVFLGFLRGAIEATGCLLHAFVLMTNHYHLVLQAGEDELSRCMHRLNGLYSRYHNKKYGLKGHTYDAPYNAHPIASRMLLLRKIAYVFLNPCDAGLVQRPQDYKWSGYRCYLGLQGSPLTINPNPILGLLDSDLEQAARAFQGVMEAQARENLRRTRRELGVLDVQGQQFGWLLEYAQEHQGGFLGESAVQVAMYWGKLCGIAPGAIRRFLGPAAPPYISQSVSRLEERIERDPLLQRALALP